MSVFVFIALHFVPRSKYLEAMNIDMFCESFTYSFDHLIAVVVADSAMDISF